MSNQPGQQTMESQSEKSEVHSQEENAPGHVHQSAVHASGSSAGPSGDPHSAPEPNPDGQTASSGRRKKNKPTKLKDVEDPSFKGIVTTLKLVKVLQKWELLVSETYRDNTIPPEERPPENSKYCPCGHGCFPRKYFYKDPTDDFFDSSKDDPVDSAARRLRSCTISPRWVCPFNRSLAERIVDTFFIRRGRGSGGAYRDSDPWSLPDASSTRTTRPRRYMRRSVSSTYRFLDDDDDDDDEDRRGRGAAVIVIARQISRSGRRTGAADAGAVSGPPPAIFSGPFGSAVRRGGVASAASAETRTPISGPSQGSVSGKSKNPPKRGKGTAVASVRDIPGTSHAGASGITGSPPTRGKVIPVSRGKAASRQSTATGGDSTHSSARREEVTPFAYVIAVPEPCQATTSGIAKAPATRGKLVPVPKPAPSPGNLPRPSRATERGPVDSSTRRGNVVPSATVIAAALPGQAQASTSYGLRSLRRPTESQTGAEIKEEKLSEKSEEEMDTDEGETKRRAMTRRIRRARRRRGRPRSQVVLETEGRACDSCGTTQTPLWRGLEDNIIHCNACGLRYKKYGVRCSKCGCVPTKKGGSGACEKCGAPL